MVSGLPILENRKIAPTSRLLRESIKIMDIKAL